MFFDSTDEENCDDNYNPYVDNYLCKRNKPCNIKTAYCCRECELERMRERRDNLKNTFNFYNQFFNDENINKPNISILDKLIKKLQLVPPKTSKEIKKQYYKLCKVYHPDKKGGDHNKFLELNETYEKICCIIN